MTVLLFDVGRLQGTIVEGLKNLTDGIALKYTFITMYEFRQTIQAKPITNNLHGMNWSIKILITYNTFLSHQHC